MRGCIHLGLIGIKMPTSVIIGDVFMKQDFSDGGGKFDPNPS